MALVLESDVAEVDEALGFAEQIADAAVQREGRERVVLGLVQARVAEGEEAEYLAGSRPRPKDGWPGGGAGGPR